MYSFTEYQADIKHSACYPDEGHNLIYPVLGLVGEAGEVAEKVKKLWRNKNITKADELTESQRKELVKELGDVLWYLHACANELNVTLASVAQENALKIKDRVNRDVIKSEGDNR